MYLFVVFLLLGSEITFGSAQKYQWQDPRLWHVATSMENLEQGYYVFSVDEERVPCQYDDVIFQPETSFRVNLESSEETIQLRSISVMGQVNEMFGGRNRGLRIQRFRLENLFPAPHHPLIFRRPEPEKRSPRHSETSGHHLVVETCPGKHALSAFSC